ncbi:MAG: hypothetical protein H6631_00700 [Anaerolineaceae bacterium]|nr:hypothetical protein [Anaerolineaceae bacterium]MCB9100312.1 hypothetical protein [Anaerolineales bacterium]
MTYQGYWLEIIDKEGWQREQPLEKRIVFIGSHPSNDIYLAGDRGAGVAAKHVQLILNQTGYKLVNISDGNVIVNTPEVKLIPPHGAMTLIDGYSIRLGDFTLSLRLGRTSRLSVDQTSVGPPIVGDATVSKKIDLQVVLPRTRLAPHKRLNGIIVVRNLGEVSGVKIDLELRGVDPSCYHVDSGPLLSSGAEQRVHFYIQHLGHLPPAGPLTIEVEASAPKSYPMSLPVIDSQLIEVLPFFSHSLTLRDPDAAEQPEPISTALPTPAAPEQPEPIPTALPTPAVPAALEPIPTAPPTPAQPPSPPPPLSTESDLPKPTVFENRPSPAVRVSPQDIRQSPGAVEKEPASLQNAPSVVNPPAVPSARPPRISPPSQPNLEQPEPKIDPSPNPKVKVEPATPLIPAKKPVQPVTPATPKAKPAAQLSPPPPPKDNPIQRASKREAPPDSKNSLPPEPDKSDEGGWWSVTEEEPVIQKQTVLKLQAKPKPASTRSKSESPSLVEDWTASDEE